MPKVLEEINKNNTNYTFLSISYKRVEGFLRRGRMYGILFKLSNKVKA